LGRRQLSSLDECLEEAVKVASERKPTLIVAGAEDPITISSVWEACRLEMVSPLLVGEVAGIEKAVEKVGADPSRFEFAGCRGEREKVVSLALDLIQQGEGSLLMKGRLNTGELLGAYLEKKRTLRTGRFLSHIGLFDSPGGKRLMMITDGGLNLAPDLARKRDILCNAVDLAHLLGIETPRVAVLAHVEKSPNHELPMIHDAEELTRENREGAITGCLVDGPLAFDNAVSKQAAERKGIGGPVAGCADILLAAEIGMGNVIYKLVQTWCSGTIAGIVAGGKIPVMVPSRADTEKSKLCAIAVGVLMAGAGNTGVE
jgi:phosphotransacetylase